MIRSIVVPVLAGILLSLSACAHRELKAPCSANADWWSSSAYASGNCGQLLPVNP